MTLGVSDLTFAHRDCFTSPMDYGVLKTQQPPHILEDGTVVWLRYCTKCGYEEPMTQRPTLHSGKLTHNHGGYGRHPISRKHQSRRSDETQEAKG